MDFMDLTDFRLEYNGVWSSGGWTHTRGLRRELAAREGGQGALDRLVGVLALCRGVRGSAGDLHSHADGRPGGSQGAGRRRGGAAAGQQQERCESSCTH